MAIRPQHAEGSIAELQLAMWTLEAKLGVAKSEASDRALAKEEAATLVRELATTAQRMKASPSEHYVVDAHGRGSDRARETRASSK